MVAVVLDDVVVHVHQDPTGEEEQLGQMRHIERFAEQLCQEGWTLLHTQDSQSELGITSLTKPRGMGVALSKMSPHKIPIKNCLYCPVIISIMLSQLRSSLPASWAGWLLPGCARSHSPEQAQEGTAASTLPNLRGSAMIN